MQHLKSTLAVRFAQLSDAGRKPENQDTIGARLPEGATLATKGIATAVADGVSSSQSARQASQTAITGFLTDYYATPDTWRTQRSALQVIESLNRYLWSQSRNSVLQEGQLTTFSALILKGDSAFIFHVGDSRIYRLRQGQLEQLTRDHSQHIDRHTQYLTRALGADPALEVDSQTLELAVGDLFLLSTDGLHEVLDPITLGKLLHQGLQDLDSLATRLLQAALERGSQDNISVQLCAVEARGTPSQNDAVAALARLPFPPLLEPGHVLDGLKVQKILHESERSQVYLVHSPQGTPLVMKTPSSNYQDDPAYIERFVMESWVGSRIHCAQVVRVVEPPESRGFLYYLTEYVPGPTLGQTIKERAPLDIGDALELMEQLIKGCRAFHRKDTLHQDLKPDNIVLSGTGPVILDFGSCWVAGVAEMGEPFERDRILGTLEYSAPEYRCALGVSARSDQFSLAVILYEMLTGHKPYGEQYASTMHWKAFQKLRYQPARRHNVLIPEWLDQALEKALSIHPNHRYDALSEWLNDLQRPNPKWLSSGKQPLLERNPVRFWQCLAAVGWLLALAALIYRV